MFQEGDLEVGLCGREGAQFGTEGQVAKERRGGLGMQPRVGW